MTMMSFYRIRLFSCLSFNQLNEDLNGKVEKYLVHDSSITIYILIYPNSAINIVCCVGSVEIQIKI